MSRTKATPLTAKGRTCSRPRPGRVTTPRAPVRHVLVRSAVQGRQPRDDPEEYRERLGMAHPDGFPEQQHAEERQQEIRRDDVRQDLRVLRYGEDQLEPDEAEEQPDGWPIAEPVG